MIDPEVHIKVTAQDITVCIQADSAEEENEIREVAESMTRGLPGFLGRIRRKTGWPKVRNDRPPR